jgi:hypothetical protein
MRIGFILLGYIVSLAACTSHSEEPAADAGPPLTSWTTRADVFVSGHGVSNTDCRAGICRHNENVDMIQWNNADYAVHRTAYSQTLGPNSSIWIYKSTDDGATFSSVATIQAPSDRDLRDPAFFTVNGELFMKALARLPVASDRDTNVDTESMITHSSDGVNWAPLEVVAPHAWSFWRVKENAGVYYSAAYADGDKEVDLFSSTDGLTWTKGAQIYGVSADTPLETELTFFPSGKMLALVRMDGSDTDLLGDPSAGARLRTKVCWASPPYSAFDCHQELSPFRLDGPVSFFWQNRLFVIARKHLPTGMRKRTALYEITAGDGGSIDDGSDVGIKEWGELPSAGDTSYAGIVPTSDHEFVTMYYAGDLDLDEAWVLAMFNLTDIWKAELDFSKLN